MIYGTDGTVSQLEQPLPGDGHLSFQGSVLIAMPGVAESTFAHSVIYMCRHDELHGMGLVLNQPIEGLDFGVMLRELNIPSGQAAPETAMSRRRIFRGGPVQNDRGFVLHSLDYRLHDATLPIAPYGTGDDSIDEGVGLTASRDILADMARGAGPQHAIIALGYAGWGPGQLENELAQNAWIVAPASYDLLFRNGYDNLWARALGSLGIDAGHLSGVAGRA
ncbi:MAG: YqgE/AlgH family protein [Asticcacaulis sp.]|nr:YqgE/AlgH family protein [Asticcacaulis sp.]